MALDHMRLEDLSDREFLLIVAEVAEDGDGWADSQEIADRLDLSKRRLASSRLSWLARWGAVERQHAQDAAGNIRYHRDGKVMHTQHWRLTAVGWQVASGELRKGLESQLDARRRRADAGPHPLGGAPVVELHGPQAGPARVATGDHAAAMIWTPLYGEVRRTWLERILRRLRKGLRHER